MPETSLDRRARRIYLEHWEATHGSIDSPPAMERVDSMMVKILGLRCILTEIVARSWSRFSRHEMAPTLRLLIVMIVALLAGPVLGGACQGTHAGAAPPFGEGNSDAVNRVPVSQDTDPGIFGGRIVFGQSAAFSGPVQRLGHDMRLGILAAFDEANRAGGVHGRRLELQSLDDGYETNAALSNTGTLIYESKVFGLIGAVGTPTSRAAFIAVNIAGVPFVAPFTGAEFLRDPELDNIVNLRAS